MSIDASDEFANTCGANHLQNDEAGEQDQQHAVATHALVDRTQRVPDACLRRHTVGRL